MSINIISKGDIQLQGFNSELQNLLSTAEALDSNLSTASKEGITIVNEYADFFDQLRHNNFFKETRHKDFCPLQFQMENISSMSKLCFNRGRNASNFLIDHITLLSWVILYK